MTSRRKLLREVGSQPKPADIMAAGASEAEAKTEPRGKPTTKRTRFQSSATVRTLEAGKLPQTPASAVKTTRVVKPEQFK
ncbi:hypothetical protein NDU88_005111 [Pleurodeles waltl]|uniref:Uncharacterized protein n=1 Tax=Pleurodeles waltl TaxID=8319 RepID=A0AAV7PF03_PLEWA|nr:hypothetical protein NDU88_005111 [Pleurodeles waltl]